MPRTVRRGAVHARRLLVNPIPRDRASRRTVPNRVTNLMATGRRVIGLRIRRDARRQAETAIARVRQPRPTISPRTTKRNIAGMPQAIRTRTHDHGGFAVDL